MNCGFTETYCNVVKDIRCNLSKDRDENEIEVVHANGTSEFYKVYDRVTAVICDNGNLVVHNNCEILDIFSDCIILGGLMVLYKDIVLIQR